MAAGQRMPDTHCWDVEEPKLLAVQTHAAVGDVSALDAPTLEVATLFSTPDDGVLLQDCHPLAPSHGGLVGILVPNLLVFGRVGELLVRKEGSQVEIVTMKQFAGLQAVDEGTRAALLSFSYYLAVRELDDGFSQPTA
jgi:hypothetical protein